MGTGLLGGWGRAVTPSRVEGNALSSHFGFIFNTRKADRKQILSSRPNSAEMTIWKEKYKKKAATLFGILLTPESQLTSSRSPTPGHPWTQAA